MTPPRLARALLGLCAPASDRGPLLSELEEEFDRLAATGTRASARRWYWRQALRSALPMLALRLGGRPATHLPVVHAETPSLAGGWLDDGRQGLRQLGRHPRVPMAVVGTLGLALAGAMAAAAVVDAVIVRPLPYPDPERIVALWNTGPELPAAVRAVSFQDLEDWRAESRTLDAVSGFTSGSHTLTGRGDPRRIEAARVGRDFERVIGVRAAMGRLFSADDFAPGAPDAIVVLTDRFWRREFGASAAVIDQTIVLDDRPRRVIGVLPATPLPLPIAPHDIWTPLVPRAGAPWESSRGTGWVEAVGRLRPGVALSAARGELSTIAQALAAAHPASNRQREAVEVQTLQETVVGGAKPALFLVAAGVAALLLVACANVMHLLVAQAVERLREFATRHALGAAPHRLRRQIVVEAAVLTTASLAVALAIAPGLLGVSTTLPASALPRRDEIAIGAAALRWGAPLFAVTFVVIAWPLIRLVSRAPQAGIASTRVAGRRADRYLRHALIAAQSALSVVLVVGSVLLVRTLAAFERIDLGFSTAGVVAMEVTPSRSHAPSAARTMAFYQALLDAVRTLPGVEAVSASTSVPFVVSGWAFSVASHDDPDSQRHPVRVTVASPDHFDALRVPMLAGRPMTPDEHRGGPDVAVISRSLARLLFGHGTAVGGTLDYSGRQWRIVGVTADVRQGRLANGEVAEVFLPWHLAGQRPQALVVRMAETNPAIVPLIADRAHAIDFAATVAGAGALADRVRATLAPQRFRATVVSGLAGLAVVLAVFGVYSVTSFGVAMQAREQAIRMALGETRVRAARRVVLAALRPAALGVAGGGAAAWFLGRFVEAMLFQVRSDDPALLAIVPALLLVLAAAGAWLPASRAARLDPACALSGDAPR